MLALLFLLLLPFLATSYHIGGVEPVCWATNLDSMAQVQLDACPPEIVLEWVTEPPEDIKEGDEFSGTFSIEVTLDDIITDPAEISHYNLHACKNELGFCTPNVAETPGLVTHALEQMTDLSGNKAVMESTMVLDDAGEYTVIAHARVSTKDTKYDVAIGLRRTVKADKTEKTISKPILILFYCIAGVCIGICCIFLLIIAVKHKHKVIRFSSPLFLGLTTLFAAVGIATCFVYGGEPTTAKCHAQIWMYGSAFSIAFSALFAKTFRIWYLFTRKSFKVATIPNWYLMVIILIMFSVEATIMILWSVVGQPHVDKDRDDNEFKRVCASNNELVWIILQSGYHLFIIAIGVFLSFQTRNVATLFNESTWIGLAVWNLLIAAVLLPIQYAIDSSPTAVFIIQCLAVILSFFGVVVLLMIPKLVLMITRKEENLQTISDTQGGRFSTGGTLTAATANFAISPDVTKNGAISKRVRGKLEKLNDQVTGLLDKDREGRVLSGQEFGDLAKSLHSVIGVVTAKDSQSQV